jgi:hypothetical protein
MIDTSPNTIFRIETLLHTFETSNLFTQQYTNLRFSLFHFHPATYKGLMIEPFQSLLQSMFF